MKTTMRELNDQELDAVFGGNQGGFGNQANQGGFGGNQANQGGSEGNVIIAMATAVYNAVRSIL